MDDQRIVTMLLKKRKTVNESKYKKYRNKLNKLIRITEKEFYTSKFESYTMQYKENVASN